MQYSDYESLIVSQDEKKVYVKESPPRNLCPSGFPDPLFFCRKKQQVSKIRWSLSTTSHDVKSQNTAILT
jgi:hypothetical protein